jgi:hypothetical protein
VTAHDRPGTWAEMSSPQGGTRDAILSFETDGPDDIAAPCVCFRGVMMSAFGASCSDLVHGPRLAIDSPGPLDRPKGTTASHLGK